MRMEGIPGMRESLDKGTQRGNEASWVKSRKKANLGLPWNMDSLPCQREESVPDSRWTRDTSELVDQGIAKIRSVLQEYPLGSSVEDGVGEGQRELGGGYCNVPGET